MKTSEPGQPGVTSQGKGRLPSIRGNDRRLRESIAEKDEAAILSREKMAEAREDAAHLREDAADMRETIVILREGKIRQAEIKQKASEYDRNILQKVNERLVIATIEANKLAEQVETARVDLDHLAHHDILTDLPNRILLQDRLGQAVEIARRQGRKFAVMFMDLDHFKHINDSLGHTVGDQLLQSVAQRLVGSVRQSDTICRQGGDEFLLLLPYIEHAEDAALSAQKMLAATALSHHIEGYDLHISVSIGISIYPDDGLDAETLIRRADTAMYYAKESGRNNYKFFELDMNVLAVQRKSIETDLRLALE